MENQEKKLRDHDKLWESLKENRQEFEETFSITIAWRPSLRQFRSYIRGLTNLERHFLGVVSEEEQQ